MQLERNGFTLMEMVFAIAIAAALMAVAIYKLNAMTMKARIAGTVADLQYYEKAAIMFYGANGRWPKDGTPSNFQAEFKKYLDGPMQKKVPPIGGQYDWNGEFKYGNVEAGISIIFANKASYPTEVCRRIDATIDDGNLATGKVRTFSDRVLQLELDAK